MIEAFFLKYNLPADTGKINYGIRQFMEHWYVGDGLFSDGAKYHWDYYNSYVIHPYLASLMNILKEKGIADTALSSKFDKMNKRYAVILERMINADGSFPATGRSIVYRTGAFHQLADITYRSQLPQNLASAQVRTALSAVLHKTFEQATSFTTNGWLKIGLYGSQPGLGDSYITTGSLYLCTAIFLPLGLPETDPFWRDPPQPWTSKKIWSGGDFQADHALDDLN